MRNRISIEGSYLIRSRALARFTAEGLLVDQPKVYGLKGWTGMLAWLAWILVVMAGPVQTSAFSDRTEPSVNVCQANP